MTTAINTEVPTEDVANIEMGVPEPEHAQAEAGDDQAPDSAPAASVPVPASF